ncbi:DUF6415 family natural product biosynthesis protein [Streptomyces sp. NBC_01262]|uniref:DUF6415 family natural product biosynthesis protein n=1 Tax=Streptomyces sp. NBC_01262 TaxID=2903803 RepID=UPI002E326EBA|nr:DUF6415 family natural product biosynthesis protein [Streptomyces sp. NBC_01262]
MTGVLRASYDLMRVKEAIRCAKLAEPTGQEQRALLLALRGHIRALLPYAEVRRGELDPQAHAWFELGNIIASARTLADSTPLPGREAAYVLLLAGSAEQLLAHVEDDSRVEMPR